MAGHGRVAAAKQLGLSEVPVLRLSHMSELEKRAFVIADNRLAEKAGWDRELLAIELGELAVLLTGEFDVTITGFEKPQRSTCFLKISVRNRTGPTRSRRSPARRSARPAISGAGRHRLICGDARDEHVFAQL